MSTSTPDFVDPYKKIWESRDLNSLNSTPVELENNRSQFRRGLGAFGDEMQATGYGLAALGAQGVENIVGKNDITSGIRDWGLEGYNRNIAESQGGLNTPNVARVEDIKNASDAMDWASYQLGKGLPMLGSLALSGGIGGAIARIGAKQGVSAIAKSAVGSAVKEGVEAGTLKAVEGQVVTQGMKDAAAKLIRDRVEKGVLAGGFTGSFGLEGGQAFGEEVAAGAKPEDAVLSATAVGGINGLLEFLPLYKVAKDIGLGHYAKKKLAAEIMDDPSLAKKAIDLAGRVGKSGLQGAAEGAAIEGVTEGLQELVSAVGQRWATKEPLFADLNSDDWSRIGNAALAGGLVGGVAAGAGHAAGGLVSPQVKITNNQKENTTQAAEQPTLTRTQVLEAMRDKANSDIELATKVNDTAKVEELTKARDIYEEKLNEIKNNEQVLAEQPIIDNTQVSPETTPIKEDQQPASEDIFNKGFNELNTKVDNSQNIIEPKTSEVSGKQAGEDLSSEITTQPQLEQSHEERQAEVASLLSQEGDVTEANVPDVTSTPTNKVLLSQNISENDAEQEQLWKEFQAVKAQFEAKQSDKPAFDKWFGEGVEGVNKKDGKPVELYHGTNNPMFYQWDESRAGQSSSHPTSGLGFFMTADKGSAARYGSDLLKLHVKVEKPYYMTDTDLTSIESVQDATKFRENLKSQGYDSAVITAPGASPYVVAFNSNQVKLSDNTNPTSSPDFRYSQPQKEINPITSDKLRASVDSVMSDGWLQRAQDLGLVEVNEGPGPNNEAGSWDGNKIRMYLGSISEDSSPLGILLHEGKHATFKDVLGDSLESYVKDLQTIANTGNQSAQSAIKHAALAAAKTLGIKHDLTMGSRLADFNNIRALIEEKNPGLLSEEELAYFIQYGTETQSGRGFIRRLIEQIKAWFAQTEIGKKFKEAGLGFELNEAMAIEWAKEGLKQATNKLEQNTKEVNKTEKQLVKSPASARIGDIAEGINKADPYYSMSWQDIKDKLWTDPTDINQELINKPGLIQRLQADFVDYFSHIEKKAPELYDTYSLMRNKKGARIEQARQEYIEPLRQLIVNSPWTAAEVGDMLAARHIKLDSVNQNLAERASYDYTGKLLASLPKKEKAELKEARAFVKEGKMLDGKDYVDNKGNKIDMPEEVKRKMMFDLMNKYAPFEAKDSNGNQPITADWEIFKDAASGFSEGGIGKDRVRAVDDVLKRTSENQAQFDKIANMFDAANRAVLDILEYGGLITKSEHARLLADKSAYAPLRRSSYNIDSSIEQLLQNRGQGAGKSLGTRVGTSELSEPTLVVQNAMAKLGAAIASAEKNMANNELYDTIMSDREGWKSWFTTNDKDTFATHDSDGFSHESKSSNLNPTDVVLIKNGKRLIIQPNLHNERAIGFVRAINNLDAQALNGPMKVLGWTNQLVRWVNVNASPAFLMMNAIRDPFTAAYNLQASEAAPYTAEIFGNYGASFRALKKVFLDGNRDQTDPDVRMVEKWENAGGRTSMIHDLKPMDESWRSFDAQVARRQGNMKQLMQVKDKWIDGLENFNLLFENVMRLSAFNTLVEKGVVSEKRAARIAQDLTTNFTRRGYKSQALGTWWLFFNATVQGNYQILRNIMSSKKVQIAAEGTIAFSLMMDILGRTLYPDDWDKRPEWDKERYITLPFKAYGDFLKIPAPWVYNVVWRLGSSIGEMQAGVIKPQDAMLDLAAMTLSTLSPVSGGSFLQRIAPTVADPFVQIAENKDFSGNPIGPEGYPGAGSKANSELLWNSTPRGYQEFARMINRATGGDEVTSGKLDLRPGDYQVLARFLTGSLGRFLSDSTFGFKDAINRGIEGPKDIPVVRELFSDPYNPMRSEKYHNNIASVYGAHKLENMYRAGPDRDLVKLHEVRTEKRVELSMFNQAKDVEKQIKSLRTQIRVAENRGDTERVKVLKDRMGQVQERFNKSFRSKMG